MLSYIIKPKMRILFIAPYTPSLIRTRSLNLITSLLKLGHSIHLICLAESTQEKKWIIGIDSQQFSFELVTLAKLVSVFQTICTVPLSIPLQVGYCFSIEMKRRIVDALKRERFDCIHVEHLRAAQFLPPLPPTAPPVLFDAVDCLAKLYRQFSLQKTSWFKHIVQRTEFKKLSLFEPRIFGKFRDITVSSQREAMHVSKLSPNSTVTVVPNGVDTHYFNPRVVHKKPIFNSIVFTGKMSYFANEISILWLYQRVMPLVWKKVRNAKLLIAGNGPSREIRNLAKDNRVYVTGFVNDLRPEIKKSAVSVCPIIVGAGTQFKLLEAMAMEKPIVATPLACRDLKVLHQRELLIADSPSLFAKSIVALLHNPSLSTQLGKCARTNVNIHYRWDKSARMLTDAYRSIAKSQRRHS